MFEVRNLHRTYGKRKSFQWRGGRALTGPASRPLSARLGAQAKAHLPRNRTGR